MFLSEVEGETYLLCRFKMVLVKVTRCKVLDKTCGHKQVGLI